MKDSDYRIPHELIGLDRLIHDPTRLMMVAFLYVVDSADFVFLKNQTGLTAGNISSHMAKLENARYVRVKKSFVAKRPQTLFRLTPKGKRAFENYRASISSGLSCLPAKSSQTIRMKKRREAGLDDGACTA